MAAKEIDRDGIASLLSREELKSVLSHINIDKLEHLLVIWTERGNETTIQLASNELSYGRTIELLQEAARTILNAARCAGGYRDRE